MCKKFHFILLFCLIFLFPFLISNGSIHAHAAVVNDSKYAKMILYGKTNEPFDIRLLKYDNLKDYSIAQGGCSDGTYGYYILLNKTKNDTCIIARVRLSQIKTSSQKAIVISKPLHLGHANDICYNPNTKKLYVVHCTEGGNASLKISPINPSTLLNEKTINLNIPKTLSGATTKELNSIKGISGIAYNSSKGNYVVTISSNDSKFLVLNINFSPIQYIKCTGKKTNYQNQGIDCDNNCIYAVRTYNASPNCSNVIDTYNWNGEYKKVTAIKGMHHEAESIYHINSTFYVPCYAYTLYQKPLAHTFINEISNKPAVEGISVPNLTTPILIKVGQTASLNAKVVPDNADIKTITYFSTNNKAVYVSPSGVCEGVGPGDASIIIATNEGVYEEKRSCIVVGRPVIQKLKNEDKGIKISWTPEALSTSITIYRSNGKFSSKYKKIATVKNVKNGYFIDDKVKKAEFYSYRISYENGKIKTPKSDEAIIYRLATPKITKISSPQEKTAKISWDRVKGAARYRIYYDTDSNFKSPQKEVVDEKTDTAVINNLKSGKTYYFEVVANYKISDENSNIVYATTTSSNNGFSFNSNESPVKQIKIK